MAVKKELMNRLISGVVINNRYYLALFLCFCFIIILGNPLRAEDVKPEAKNVQQSAPVPTPVPAAKEIMPTGDFTLDVLSKYYGKGQEWSRNSVVIQPSVTVGYKGFSVYMWGNLDMGAYNTPATQSKTAAWNETDLGFSYRKTIGLFNLEALYVYYANAPYYKGAVRDNDQQEVIGTIGLNTILSPTIKVYKYIDNGRRWYFKLGASHTFTFNKYLGLKLAGTAGYLAGQDTDFTSECKFDDNALKTNDTYNGLLDGVLTVSLPISPGIKNVTITPTISYAFPLTADARNYIKGMGMEDTTPSNRSGSYVFGGVSFNYSF